jgi:hypothetical protein
VAFYRGTPWRFAGGYPFQTLQGIFCPQAFMGTVRGWQYVEGRCTGVSVYPLFRWDMLKSWDLAIVQTALQPRRLISTFVNIVLYCNRFPGRWFASSRPCLRTDSTCNLHRVTVLWLRESDVLRRCVACVTMATLHLSVVVVAWCRMSAASRAAARAGCGASGFCSTPNRLTCTHPYHTCFLFLCVMFISVWAVNIILVLSSGILVKHFCANLMGVYGVIMYVNDRPRTVKREWPSIVCIWGVQNDVLILTICLLAVTAVQRVVISKSQRVFVVYLN